MGRWMVPNRRKLTSPIYGASGTLSRYPGAGLGAWDPCVWALILQLQLDHRKKTPVRNRRLLVLGHHDLWHDHLYHLSP